MSVCWVRGRKSPRAVGTNALASPRDSEWRHRRVPLTVWFSSRVFSYFLSYSSFFFWGGRIKSNGNWNSEDCGLIMYIFFISHWGNNTNEMSYLESLSIINWVRTIRYIHRKEWAKTFFFFNKPIFFCLHITNIFQQYEISEIW